MDLKKLIANLKAEGLSEEDAVKLIQGEFDAENRGLIQKRDELLAQEIKLKEKNAVLEAAATESAKNIAILNDQIKKNNPEEYKKLYEDQLKQLGDKHAAALAVIEADRDRFRDSHFARIKEDAIQSATKDLVFIDGLRDGFISVVMQRNQFAPSSAEIDGKFIFTNQDGKSLESVLHEFSLTNEGKAYIKNTNAGAGSGGVSGAGACGGGQVSGNPFVKGKGFNLTEQGRLYKEDRSKYDALKAEAAEAEKATA